MMMFSHGSNWSRKGSNAAAECDLSDAPYSIVCRLHDRKEETLLNRKIGFFFLRVWPVFLRLSPVWCIWFPIPVSESCFFSPADSWFLNTFSIARLGYSGYPHSSNPKRLQSPFYFIWYPHLEEKMRSRDSISYVQLDVVIHLRTDGDSRNAQLTRLSCTRIRKWW